MDYIFHNNEAKLSIVITKHKKGGDEQWVVEITCNGDYIRDRVDGLADVLNLSDDWTLNHEYKKFIKKNLPEEVNSEILFKKISETLKEHEPLTGIQFLEMIESAVYYSDTHHIDVTINSKVFTIKDTDYSSSSHMKIWIMSQFGRILSISDKQWVHIIKHIRDISINDQSDPTAPPVVSTLLDLVESNNIFSDFCDDFVSSLQSGGSQTSFMLKGDTLYVPSDVYDFLRRKFAMTYGSIRQYTDEYLKNKRSSEVETITVHGKKKSFRFWHFSFKKLWEARNTISQKEVIDVTEEMRSDLYESAS